jgi:hypothetical protein
MKGIPFMLVLGGLPMLESKLAAARPFASVMFHTQRLGNLDTESDECRDAILKPLPAAGITHVPNDEAINTIVKMSKGYPYFIQFI